MAAAGARALDDLALPSVLEEAALDLALLEWCCQELAAEAPMVPWPTAPALP